MAKKFPKFRTLLFIPILLFAFSYLWQKSIIPYEEITSLKNCYINHQTASIEINYILTEERPESWTDINELPASTVQALLISEDPHYWGHNGIKYNKILEALYETVFHGKRMRGHSSITQQFAKNFFLTSERTLSRKIKEVFITWELEKELPKIRLLELYINIVYFGNSTYGLNDAACHYFSKSASELAPNEAIYLFSLLPNPQLFSEGFRNQSATNRDLSAIERVLKRLYKQQIISCEEYEEMLTTTLSF